VIVFPKSRYFLP